MPHRKKPTLLAQGKPRTLAAAGEGKPWKRVLQRASSEEETRKILAQAELLCDYRPLNYRNVFSPPPMMTHPDR
jgi:hypothetical protein